MRSPCLGSSPPTCPPIRRQLLSSPMAPDPTANSPLLVALADRVLRLRIRRPPLRSSFSPTAPTRPHHLEAVWTRDQQGLLRGHCLKPRQQTVGPNLPRRPFLRRPAWPLCSQPRNPPWPIASCCSLTRSHPRRRPTELRTTHFPGSCKLPRCSSTAPAMASATIDELTACARTHPRPHRTPLHPRPPATNSSANRITITCPPASSKPSAPSHRTTLAQRSILNFPP